MKLVSTPTELLVLRNICSNDPAVAGSLLASVDSSYFHNAFIRDTFERIQETSKETGNIPKWRDVCEDPALSEKARDKLKSAPTSRIRTVKEASNSVTILNRYRQLRGIYELAEQAVDSCRKTKASPDKILTKIADTVVSLRQNKSVQSDALVFGAGNNSSQFVKDMMTAETHDYLPTLFKAFDEENQGFGWGNLVVLAGTTGGGKSSLAAQLGVNFASLGEDVTFVPLEMTKKEMASRILANASGIDVRKILFGKMSPREKKVFWKAYKKFVVNTKNAGGTFRIFKPDVDMTIEEILASTYPYNSRVIVIDYISLLKGVDGDDAWQKLGAVARYCKVYAETHNKIIILLAQLSDEGMIRYSKAIFEHANYAWKFVATAATREQEIINIEQAKARNGRLFPFTLKSTLSNMRIRDLDLEEKEALSDNTARATVKSGKGGKGNKFSKAAPKEKVSTKASSDYLKDLSDEDDDE